MEMPLFLMVLTLLIATTTASSSRRMKRAVDYGSGSCLKSLNVRRSTQDIVSVCVGKAGHSHKCAGVHIGKGRVLTAAHCLFMWPHRKGSRCKATKRNDYFTIVSQSSITVSGSKAVHHRSYSYDSWSKNSMYLRYDAAVLFTGSSRISNERTCPTVNASPSTNDTCYVYKRNSGYKNVTLLPCRLGSGLLKPGEFRRDLLCIKAIDDFSFAVGDSGSPVYCMSSAGEYYLRGIISAQYTSPKSAIVINTRGNIPIEGEMNWMTDCRASLL